MNFEIEIEINDINEKIPKIITLENDIVGSTEVERLASILEDVSFQEISKKVGLINYFMLFHSSGSCEHHDHKFHAPSISLIMSAILTSCFHISGLTCGNGQG